MTTGTASIPAVTEPDGGLQRRRIAGLVVLAVLLVAGSVASLAVGVRTMDAATTVDALLAIKPTLADPGAASGDFRAVAQLRFPRTLIAVVVGAGLGVAGALIQGHTRNPLADPAILGISSGAAFAVVCSGAFFSVTSVFMTAVWAFGGSVATTALVFALAGIGGGRLNPLTLILGGAATSAVLTSLTSLLVLSSDDNLDRMRFWTAGSLDGRGFSVLFGATPLILVGLVTAFSTGPSLNLLNLGDDVAAGLGVNTRRARTTGMLTIALLAGAATAAAGPLGFLGLVVPHIVRALTGPDYRWILPYAAIAGADMLLAADILGRMIVRPGELQAGIVLALAGAPFFIWLIAKKRVQGL